MKLKSARWIICGVLSSDSSAVKVENATARQGDTLAIDLIDGGGFIGRFTKE